MGLDVSFQKMGGLRPGKTLLRVSAGGGVLWGRCAPRLGAHGRVGGKDGSGGAAEEGEIPGAPASSDTIREP